MTGLAGIGYGLLRLADPSAIPSVLTLECPRSLATRDDAPVPAGETIGDAGRV
jgi:hypothetical protein